MKRRPRPYQEAALAKVEEAFQTHRSTLVVMATGLGKTVLFGEIARRWLEGGPRRRVLVIAHREELVMQAAATLEDLCGCEVGVDMEKLTQRHRKAVVASVQSLSRGRVQGYDFSLEWLVVIDEAHHATAKTYRVVAKWFGLIEDRLPDRCAGSRLLGVTATPQRGDGEALKQVFDSVAYEMPIHVGVEEGWLCPIEQRSIFVKDLDFSKVRSTAGDLNEGDLDKILTEEGALHGIALKAMEHARGRPTLLFCATVNHAELLSDVLNRYEPNSAAFLSGATEKEKRRSVIRAYKEGRIRYLCNCSLFLEGFDAPSTACVGMARPTTSIALYAQVLGRGTRPLPGTIDGAGLHTAELRRAAIAASGKPSMTMLDFVGNAGRHRLVSSVDVLGGQCTLEEIDLAQALVKARGELGGDAQAALRAARAIREFDKAVRDSAKEDSRRSAAARRARIVADGVVADETEVDPFKARPKRKKGEPKMEFKPLSPNPLSEKQWHYLRRLGVDGKDALKFTRRQAGSVIDKLLKQKEFQKGTTGTKEAGRAGT